MREDMTKREWNKYQKALKNFKKASENYVKAKGKDKKKALFILNNSVGR